MAKYACMAFSKNWCADQCFCSIGSSENDPPTKCLYSEKTEPNWLLIEDDEGNRVDFSTFDEECDSLDNAQSSMDN